MTQAVGSVPLTWETWVAFPVPNVDPTLAGHGAVNCYVNAWMCLLHSTPYSPVCFLNKQKEIQDIKLHRTKFNYQRHTEEMGRKGLK